MLQYNFVLNPSSTKMIHSCLIIYLEKLYVACVSMLTWEICEILPVQVIGSMWVDLGMFLRPLPLKDAIPSVTNYRL